MNDNMTHEWNVRVYYEDTDAGGIVYHANYLKFCERARTELLRSLGIEQDSYLKHNIAFVVTAMDIKFNSAAKFNDELVVFSEVLETKRASVTFLQVIKQEERVVFTAQVKVACVDSSVMRPSPMPKEILEVLRSAS
jgi:acyl-CoA thioester hydrolase